MENAIFQQEQHISTLSGHSWESLDNSLLVDPDLYFNNADESTGLLDAQSPLSMPEDFDHFVDAVDWKALGDAQFNVYPSVAMEAVAQDIHTPLVETYTHPIVPAPNTFAADLSPQNATLRNESNAFEDPDFQFQTTYTYPDPLESTIPVQEPYFNSSHMSSMHQTFNPTEGTSNPFTSAFGFEDLDGLGSGFPENSNAQLDAPFYGASEAMPFAHDRSLDSSLMQHLASVDDHHNDHIPSFAGEQAYQTFPTPPNSFHSPYSATTPGQYMYNSNTNDQPGYIHPHTFPSETSSVSTGLNHFSPNLRATSPYYPGQASPLPSQDEDEDSGSEYSEEQENCSKIPNRRRVITRKGSKEKPRIPKDKPWIRINRETRGGTSRTLKINNYNPDEMYEQLPHPIGPWSAGHSKRKFEYSSHHELADREMTIARLKQFIQCHPRTDDCKLTLYIQRTPADSKRRYGSDQTERCRFEDCPARLYGKSVASRGLITPGNYRVAFDEFSYGYGTNKGSRADPFKVAFFVHLYCLERFLDFPALCRLDNISVEADHRQAMPSEPNAKFGAALLGPELKIAASFIDSCRSGNLRSPNGEWTNYPHHTKIGSEIKWKDHYDTLNYRLQNSKNTIRSSKVQRQGKLTNIAMHCGNLDVVHKAMKEMYNTQADVPGWRYTDKHGVFTGERNDPPEGWILDPREPVKPPRPRQKRHVEEIESDEEDENERTNKMARRGEYTYGDADGIHQTGLENGYSTRNDYLANAFCTPAVYNSELH